MTPSASASDAGAPRLPRFAQALGFAKPERPIEHFPLRVRPVTAYNPPALDVADFVAKWRKASLQNEMQVYTDHLDDLCRLANHPTRLEYDTTGERFAVQKAVTKLGGTTGAADAWFRGHFAIEYKGKGGDLDAAYIQLLQYRDNLENPPLLMVCDLDRIIIRTNYTGRTTRKIELSLDVLASGDRVGDTGLTAVEIVRKCFHQPLELVPEETTAKLTETVATQFQGVAINLRDKWGHGDMEVARFLTKLVFCMFASDTELLPKNIISTIIDNYRTTSAGVAGALSRLFVAMNEGSDFGAERLRHFNGGLFSDPVALAIDSDNLDALRAADQQNWADVEPSIFGTLFERIIDEKQRKALGKHYTSREDIELLIHPVIMWPLLREWGGEDAIDQPFDAPPTGGLRREVEHSMSYNAHDVNRRAECHAKLQAFIDRLGRATVLDPACGSGNFLYVALEKLVALEHEVVKLGLAWGLPKLERRVHPRQMFGIEKNEYAHQLASTVVWIGYLQSKRKRGDYEVDDPVLEPLDNIENKDAILDLSDPANPKEPEWPKAEFIVGNPPFLGVRKLRAELGSDYVDGLWSTYHGRVARTSDFCCYWFERGRKLVAGSEVERSGLVATQNIRGRDNRATLSRIRTDCSIFFAESNRPWVLNGAAIRIAMVAWDAGAEARKTLDGDPVEGINTDLSTSVDRVQAQPLGENKGISFQGDSKVGPFDITVAQAEELSRGANPNGRPNSDVVLPWANGNAVTGRGIERWIIDFVDLSEEEASKYEKPFEYVKAKVKAIRDKNRRSSRRNRWWRHGEIAVAMRREVKPLPRFLVTVSVATHRLFVWMRHPTLPDHRLYVFARADDYFFGVLHSRVHEVWAIANGSWQGAGNDPVYNNTTCFETFPLPWPPGNEPVDAPLYKAIAEAARELNELRERALNPDPPPEPEELKTLTLTNLYNRMKAGELTWLANAHEKLDRAVFAAYGWEYPLDDQQILSRLLAENLRRSGGDTV